MGSSEMQHKIAQISKVDLVGYLADLGYQPTKIRGLDFWYLSPLRNERTASFKVNRRLNRWYDFGTGNGGSLLDFGLLYFNCTIGDFITRFKSESASRQDMLLIRNASATKIMVTKVKRLSAPSLIRYLTSRGIGLELADQYCNQVHYSLKDKEYFGIGFRNDSGGYEIRNPFFKCSSNPKDITTIKNHCSSVSVFEGFMDFLSFLVLFDQTGTNLTDYLILNSLSFFNKSMLLLQSYQQIFLYLDNDEAGHNCSLSASRQTPAFKCMNHLYKDYKDINDMLVSRLLPPLPAPMDISPPIV
jgi:hypothetical protein